MPCPASLAALAAHGVRLKVLAQVFPVLRHDAVGPLSNATLAAAMLRQAPEGADAAALRQRSERLAGDITSMLEDSVDIVRNLDQWLADNQAVTPAAALLQECRKLLFSQLLLSRHSVAWPETVADIALPQFTSRYLLLAWLLALLQQLPANVSLTLDMSQADVWHAHLSAASGAASTAEAALDPLEVALLAEASGWRLERQPQCWSLHLPVQHAD